VILWVGETPPPHDSPLIGSGKLERLAGTGSKRKPTSPARSDYHPGGSLRRKPFICLWL